MIVDPIVIAIATARAAVRVEIVWYAVAIQIGLIFVGEVSTATGGRAIVVIIAIEVVGFAVAIGV